MNRREFLKIVSLGALTMLAGGYGRTLAKDSGKDEGKGMTFAGLSKGRKVDFHSHAILPSYIHGMEKLGIDSVADELGMLLNITDEEHIVYGSDYPYVIKPILLQKKKALDDVLMTRQWAEQVYVKNAAALLTA